MSGPHINPNKALVEARTLVEDLAHGDGSPYDRARWARKAANYLHRYARYQSALSEAKEEHKQP